MYITIGVFDGIHRGHKKVLHLLTRTAKQQRAKSMLLSICFPQKNNFTNPDRGNPDNNLLTEAEKNAGLSTEGIDYYTLIQYSKIRDMTYNDFLIWLTSKIKLAGLIASDKLRIGKDRKGTPFRIKKYLNENFPETYVHYIPSVKTSDRSGCAISSTLIKKHIRSGNVRAAAKLLGNPYSVSGKIIHGKKFGRTLGFPTANMELPKSKIVPGYGVYICTAEIEKQLFPGVCFIGTAGFPGHARPNLPRKPIPAAIETHLLNFSKTVYNKVVKIEFLQLLRKSRHFSNPEALSKVIAEDCRKARSYFYRRRISYRFQENI